LVDNNSLANPEKLFDEGYPGLGKPGKGAARGTASRSDANPDPARTDASAGTTAAGSSSEARFAGFSGLSNASQKVLELSADIYGQAASQFWTKDFLNDLSTAAGSTLDRLYSGADKERVKGGNLDAGNPDKTSHKPGDRWSENGVNYFVDDRGDLIGKDKSGVHFKGSDGLRYDSNGKDAILTKNGETVEKKGDQYFKKYADGEEVQIKDKGDIEAIVKLEGMVFEQKKSALSHLDANKLADAANDQSKVLTGNNELQVIKVDDKTGTVVGKSSNEKGAMVHLADGSNYRVENGKVFAVDSSGAKTEVKDGDLPAEIKRGPDGTLKIGSVSLTQNNEYHDSEHSMSMSDEQAKITAQTAKGLITAEVKDGLSVIQTPDHSYEYDDKGGKYVVLNAADRSVDLSYDNATRNLVTDGVTFTPNGTQIGNTFIGNDGSLSNPAFSSDDNDKKAAKERDKDAEKAKEAQEAVNRRVSSVASGISSHSATEADVAELQTDLAILSAVQNSGDLSAQAKEQVIAEEGFVRDVLAKITPQAQANDLAKGAGLDNPELTKEVVDSGKTVSAAEAALRRYGLLPLELYDATNAA
jgi:hypothetical protein